MSEIIKKLQVVRKRIQQAEQLAGREPGSVKLLAVSKGQSIAAIEAAYQAGQTAFGESYLQEALVKIEALRHYSIEWHFIGTIQSNKTSAIAKHFSWVHSVNRIKLVKRLHDARPEHLPLLNVCIEINIANEPSKSGATLQEVRAIAAMIVQCERLQLRGLMVIPQKMIEYQKQVMLYQEVQLLQKSLLQEGYALDTLSMGMSNDFAAAIAANSNLVRIGTAIFGPR